MQNYIGGKLSNKERNKKLRRLKAKHRHELKRKKRQKIEKTKTEMFNKFGIEMLDTQRQKKKQKFLEKLRSKWNKKVDK